MPASCLVVGSNPNIAFYAWRLYKTDSLEDLTLVNPQLNKNLPITWRSPQLGSSQYKPHDIYSSLKQVPPSKKFDVVILGCSSLQDFQGTCVGLKNFIHPDSIILVELTGYVNLEPYVTANFAKAPVNVLSIMNESDVRIVNTNEYSHQLRNTDTRIYLGSTSGSSKIANNKNFQKIYKLLQQVQEQSHSTITLLKSLSSKEFMTYQWKLALPRVIFNPIMTLFEISFPEELSKHILSKPLITGLINELFKLIKKMDCKLVKGFENEANLLKYYCGVYPATKQNADYVNSPSFLYRFNKHLDLELDLLLLQPILLSDDNGVRTPYLENIYSTMSQFQKINSPGGSIFFQRKGEQDATANGNSLQHKQLDSDIEQKIQKQKKLDAALKDIEISKISLDNDIIKQDMNLKSIQQKIAEAESRLSNLLLEYDKKSKAAQYEHEEKLRRLAYEHDQRYKSLDQEYKRKTKDLESAYNNRRQDSVADISPVSIPATHPSSRQDEAPRNLNRDSVMTQSGLQEYKNFVQYGDAIGPDTPVIQQKQHASPLQPILQSSPKDEENGENFVDAAPSHLKQPYEQNRRQASSSQQPFAPYNGQQGNDYPGQQGYFEQQQQQPPMPPQHQKLYRNGHQQQPNFPGNGSVPPPQLQHQHSHSYQQRQNYNPAYNTSFSSDQAPPHGLPNGGMSQNQFPPPLRSNGSMVGMNKHQGYPPMGGGYNGGPQQPVPPHQQAPQMQRLNSMPGSMSSYYEHQPQGSYSQSNTNHSSFNNAAPIDPFIEQRFRPNAKKNNRRSTLPMNGNLDGLDMGGRGGMPLPGTGRKSVSMMGSYSNGQPQQPTQRRASSSGPIMLNQGGGGAGPTPQPPQQMHGNHLRPPSMNDSQTSSSSANSNDTPKTNNDNININLNVPTIDSSNAKPLGGISSSNKGESNDKKKRGLFGKRKK
ncbi:Styryl dye vacuolar localization protein 3 [Candida viswanathii]|uniref:Styryl dye vacuolar localization protein 3 n=1 Tax=Candida viswanathii TaxID=5486 RepID=A0A367YFV0_9ASCO|nr:Styryl dye vacuolar localization protein 3 [Candida viswanathii]